MLGDLDRFRLLGLVLLAAWYCDPALADEAICVGIQSELATLKYSSFHNRSVSVSIKLPQQVYWDEDEYRYVTERPSPTEEAFEFVRLKLIVNPEDEDSGRLQLRLELETWKEADTVEQALSGTVNESVVHAGVSLANHEGSMLSLLGYYWAEWSDEDGEGGCISHLKVEIELPGRPDESPDANDGAGERAAGSTPSGNTRPRPRVPGVRVGTG